MSWRRGTKGAPTASPVMGFANRRQRPGSPVVSTPWPHRRGEQELRWRCSGNDRGESAVVVVSVAVLCVSRQS
jgi:hypothetical protein